MTTKFYYKTETRNNNKRMRRSYTTFFSDFQVEQLRLERERELQEMRRMREQEMEMEEFEVAKLRSTKSSSLQDGPKKTECCWGHIAPIPGTSCRWKSQLDSLTPDPGNSFLIRRKSRIKPSPVKSI